MRAIDCEQWFWFLFEEDGSLFLDVNCNLSSFGYSYMIRLNSDEQLEYEKNGREYIRKIAQEIQDSAPVLKDTKSSYAGRDVTNEYSDKATDAAQQWRRFEPETQ